jgi:hypothetical protein
MAIVCAVLIALSFARVGISDSENSNGSSASSLLSRAFSNLYGSDYVQVMTLETQSGTGRTMKRRMQVTRKQSDKQGKALMRFLDPFDVRKTAILLLENQVGSDDLYVYLPAAGLTKHLSNAQRADAFFGTDLAYEDIEPKYASDYEAHFVDAASESGEACKVVEAIPKPDLGSSYEKMVSCIEPVRGVIRWTDLYRHKRIVKRIEIELNSVREIGSRLVAFVMNVDSPERGTSTRIVTESYEARPSIPESLFSTWNLESGDAQRDRSRSRSKNALEQQPQEGKQ